MCLSAPPRDPDQIPLTGVHPWTAGVWEVPPEQQTEEWGEYGLFGPDDDDSLVEIDWHLVLEDLRRQEDVWMGRSRPIDDDDWRKIYDRFSEDHFNYFGENMPFHEWNSIWGEDV